ANFADRIGPLFRADLAGGRVGPDEGTGRHFSGKAIGGDGLQMGIARDAFQQDRHRHRAIVHRTLVGDIVKYIDVAGLRVGEQLLGAP
nr:hypothetical protein [Tanacetum cinerariifolium]